MSLGYDVHCVFFTFGRSEGAGDCDGFHDGAHDGVDGGVEAEGFADAGVEEGEVAEFFVGHGAEAAVGGAEVFDLFLVQGFAV